MNQFIPDWSNMGDTFASLGEHNELIELLWCNGHVVMQSQAHRKPPMPEKAAAAAAVQDDEAAPWFPYPLDDSLEKDFFSELFDEMPGTATANANASKPCKAATGGEEARCGIQGAVTASQSKPMLVPPKPAHVAASVPLQETSLGNSGSACSISELVIPRTAAAGTAATEAGESSMLTIGSSICGSNHVQTHSARTRGVILPMENRNANARAQEAKTVTSPSSRRLAPCAARTAPSGNANRKGKRKQGDIMESGSPSADVEFESAAEAAPEPQQKLTTARRRRAAEVHNLSERRRRDRINEKMKALQELIPHCNKTDKASMLDEAIEYLKSLQLQVQMMWMGGGGGIAPPVMFPGVHHQYMQRMGVGMSPPMAPMPSMPFMAPQAVPNPPVNHLPDPYGRCLAVDHLQPPSLHYMQGMGFYTLGAPKTVQENLTQNGIVQPAATTRTLSSEATFNKKYENCSKSDIKDISS